MLNMVLMGLPGAGKGTQAQRVAQRLEIPHISTGEIFRAAMKEKTTLGLKAQAYIQDGKLVPDEVTIGVIQERITNADCYKGFILDGFPRTVPQAKALRDMLENLQITLDYVIYIDVPESDLVKRLSGRRICVNCATPYHDTFFPPEKAGKCHCGGELQQREDDQEETVTHRLEVSKEKTLPVLDFYDSLSVLHRVDGTQPIDDVTLQIEKLLMENRSSVFGLRE